jgi:hypothetical protein
VTVTGTFLIANITALQTGALYSQVSESDVQVLVEMLDEGKKGFKHLS